MSEQIVRVVEGTAYQIQLSLARGGEGWVAWVRRDGRVVATASGASRDGVLQRALSRLRGRGEKVLAGTAAGPVLTEPLRSARGALPRRAWEER